MVDKSSELERIYTIPLRRAKMGTRSKRANRAIADVRNFLTRHMKSDAIWISTEINESIWSRGKFNIRSKIRVRATRFNDGVVEVTLPDQASEGSVREAIQERQEKAAETPVLAAPMPEEGEEESPGRELPVTEIDGIGPATAEKLAEHDIETIGDLLDAGPHAVAEATGHHDEAVEGWMHQAQHLAGAEHLHGDSEE